MAGQATLYVGGPILTMQDDAPEAEALLTQGEKIIAVGSEADVRAQMPEGCEVVDLAGKTLMPAFIDPHGHFPDPGFNALYRVDLAAPPRGDCLGFDMALGRLRAKAEATPDGEWVMGVLFDNSAQAYGRMPTRAELDSVSTRHPVWVLHASGHNGVANSVALERYGLDADTPDPVGGRFGRDPASGALTGLIEGISAMGEMGDTEFLIDRTRFWEGFATCRDEYLGHGVTMAQNAWVSPELMADFASLPAGVDPGIDLVLLPQAEMEPALSTQPGRYELPDTPYFTLGPRKLFADGSFQLQTALLSQPYHKVANPDAPCGMAYCTPEVLRADFFKLHDIGFQVHCHSNGDGASDLFLDITEEALARHPREDHRHTIIHGQVMREDQLARAARLGVTVSFFPAHVHFWGDRHYDTFLGPERAARISPCGSALRHGVRFTIHNDASVTPTRPLHLAHCAVNRVTAEGRLLGEDQRISVMDALKAQTIDAAWQVFQEDTRGSLAPGKLADLVVLSRNPVETPETIADIRVERTIRRGRVVYDA